MMTLNNEVDVIELMNKRLPSYAVKCLLVAGFDATDAICAMEMGDGPSNSITTIENFINSHFQGNEQYYSNAVLATGPFVFPPGHKIRIANFVAEVHSMLTLVSKKRKHPIPSGTHQNKVPRKGPDLTLPSRDKHTTLQAEAHSISSVKDQVRKSINRWVKEQPPGMLKSLSESQHFVIDVKETHTHGQLVAAVRCGACKKSIRLQVKEVVTTGTTSYLISNWTRHARSCHKLLFKSDQQKSLGMYLNTLSQSKSIDGSALVSVVNCDGYENTETHTAGPSTSINFDS